MTRKIDPKPLPISMIQKHAVDMVLKTFSEVDLPENGFEVDSLGTTMILSGIDRATEPLIDLEEKPRSSIKNLKKESGLYFAPEAGPVDNDLNYPYSDYFILSSFVEKKGFLIFCATKECPVLDEHNEDSWYATMQIQFFHGGKTIEECQRVVEVLEEKIINETFGRLFESSLEFNTKLASKVLEVFIKRISEMETKKEDIGKLLVTLKNATKKISKEYEAERS